MEEWLKGQNRFSVLFLDIYSCMENRVLKIFDMDRTLIETPEFEDFVDVDASGIVDTNKSFPEHFKVIKSLFWNSLMREVSFKKEGEHIFVLSSKNGLKFNGIQLSQILAKEPKAEKYLELFDDAIIVKSPGGFYSDPDTLGYSANNQILKEYENAQNKMILTGRGEKLRVEILKMLRFLGMEEPNQGLMLWPGQPRIMEWKASKIVEAAASGKWNEIHFYEDRGDWLVYAKEVMEKSYPNIKFVTHYVTSNKK